MDHHDNMVFTSQTHLSILYLMYYFGNMHRLAIGSSSGPYIHVNIQILIYSKCVLGTENLHNLY